MGRAREKIIILIAIVIGMCSIPISCIVNMDEQQATRIEQVEIIIPTHTKETEAYTAQDDDQAQVTRATEELNGNGEQPEPTGVPIAIVVVNSANIRNGPGTNYDKIGYAVRDGGFLVVGKNETGDWYNIQLNKSEYGWIAASVVETLFIENVSISATIPSPPAIQGTPLPQQPVCDCSGDKYNCSSFSRQWQAQSCYNYCVQQNTGDIHGLDQDNDGRVCESLP